jgi:hypothetical protein
MRRFRLAVSIALACGVAGCVLPPAFTIASFVADGISLASSGKTVTDHAISLLAHRDCRLWRLIQGKSICGADASVVAVAKLPPPLPLRAASPGLDAPAPVVAVTTPAEAPTTAEPAPAPMAEAPTPTAAPAPPSPPPASVASSAPTPPAAAAPTRTAAAPAGSPPRPRNSPTTILPPHPTPPVVAVSAPAPQPAARHVASDSRVRGEMIIRSGTDETEARALADSLHAAGAFVRPVRQGDITIYEVVMGLSG